VQQIMCLEKKAGNPVGPKIGGQNHQGNDEVGPVFTGGRVHSLSAVTCLKPSAGKLGPDDLFDPFRRTRHLAAF
ncbi:MAG: hypothetical protein ABII06_15445, partial [Pseudomonadota bacterium]